MKLIINKIIEPSLEIMEDWFMKRTKKHIKLVNEFAEKAIQKGVVKDVKSFQEQLSQHDKSKFVEPERKPYIYLSYKYKIEREKQKVQIDNELKNKIHQATLHHVQNNKHHPEFWSNQTNIINQNNRDGIPKEIVNATKMDDNSIIEMCCDWCAMSKEKGNTPFEWADKMVNTRWKFTKKQTEFIYNILNKLWLRKL